MGENTEKGRTDGKKSLRNQKMMRSKEQLVELTLQWKINHLFFPLRPWRKKAGAEKIFCSAGEDIAIRGKKILLIIYLHPNSVCLPSRHNHCLMERLPLKGAGVIGTSSNVKELTLPLAVSHLSSHSFFYHILQVPSSTHHPLTPH